MWSSPSVHFGRAHCERAHCGGSRCGRTISGLAFLGLIFALGACTDKSATTVQYETPAEVLVAMKDMYEGSWYQRLTFIQTTVQYDSEGVPDTTTWFEAMDLPGKLRIDIGEPNSENTWLFRNDSIYVFSQGILADSRPTFHPLLLLGFDAYFLEPAVLINKLDSLGFDVSVMSDTTWQGRAVYAIGAVDAGLGVQQFWIDKERLVFVRLFQHLGDGSLQQDIRFNNYEPIGGGWVAPEVEFYVDGRLQMREIYNNPTVPSSFDARLFSPSEWRNAEHWFGR